jgi:PKD repeat protein
MRNLIILVWAICISPVLSLAQIYIAEDFSTATGSTPPAGWTQVLIAGDPAVDQWRFDNPGGQSLVAPISDPAAIFDSDFLSDNNTPENVLLESPVFDASGATAVNLSFDHFFEAGFGGAYFVEVYTGTVWDTVLAGGAFSTNNPQNESIDISAQVAGVSNAQIRFRWEGDYSWFWILDNILVFSPVNDDLGITSITEPVSSCDPGAMAPVTVTIFNYGLVSQSTFDLAFTVDGGTPNIETYSGSPIAPGSSAVYAFTNGVNLSTPGFHSIQAFTILAGDGLNFNDTTVKMVEKFSTAAPYPLFEDFNSYSSGATTFIDFDNSPDASREFEVNFGATGSGFTGPNGDAPNNGNGGYIYLESSGSASGDYAEFVSHCIDLSNAQYPNLIFSRHLYGATIDSFKVNVNHGNTTNLLTVIGDELNSSNDPWIIDTLDLAAFVGTSINLVFSGYVSDFQGDIALDNIIVKEVPPTNAAVSAIQVPEPSCDLSTNESITITLVNEGSLPILGGSIMASFSIDMGPYSPPEAFPDTLQPGDSGPFTFSAPADLSADGPHQITAAISLMNDSLNANDTIQASTYTIPIIDTFPYAEDFESGIGGWIADGTNASWEFGNPNKNTIIGAASGLNAWTTGGLSSNDYNSNETSFVISPCFDMTNLPPNAWVGLDIWWNSEFSWDGTTLQYSTDGGSSWLDLGGPNQPYNWYNYANANPNSSLRPSWSGRASTSNGSGGWVQAKHPLAPAIFGASDVRFRILFTSDGSINDDGFAFDNFVIGVPPVVEFGPDSLTACIGDMLDAGLSGSDYTFLWSTGATTSSITIQNNTGVDSVQDIWVLVTDSLGLCASDTVTVTIPGSVPLVNAMVDNNNPCFGDALGQATANGSGGLGMLTYTWNTTPPQNSATAINLSAGTYEVIVSDENNCSTSDTVVISEPDPLEVNSVLVSNENCLGDSSGQISLEVSGGTIPYTYAWSNGDTTKNATGLTIGNYTLAITDSNGCELTTPLFQIQANDSLPQAGFTFMPGDVDYAVQFTNTSTSGATYNWDFGDSTTSTEPSPNHQFQTNGPYTVTLTVSNECGSVSFSDTLNVMQVGLENSQLSARINVYPNPAHDFFEIAFSNLTLEEVRVSLFALNGQEIYTREIGKINGTQNEKIELPSEMVSGLYLLRITARDAVIHKKIRLE